MKITHKDVGREVLCKNGEICRIYPRQSDLDKFMVVKDVHQVGYVIFTTMIDINDDGTASHAEQNQWNVKEFINND